MTSLASQFIRFYFLEVRLEPQIKGYRKRYPDLTNLTNFHCSASYSPFISHNVEKLVAFIVSFPLKQTNKTETVNIFTGIKPVVLVSDSQLADFIFPSDNSCFGTE